MQNEFAVAGIDIHIVSINTESGLDSAQKLVDVCAFPLLQDTVDTDVWGLLQGKKDDMFILDTSGAIVKLLPQGGELSTNLSTEEGYNNVKYSLYQVLGMDTPSDWPPSADDGGMP